MKTSDAIKYGSIAVGAVSATILALNYFNEKTHKKLQAELLALQLEEYRSKKNNGFRNFTGIIDVSNILPTKKSTTQEWCTFYSAIKQRYGKETAEILFSKAWAARKGASVKSVEVKECTGLNLDTSWTSEMGSKFNKLFDTGFNTLQSTFKFTGTAPKILFYGGIGVGIIIIGVVAYKAITTNIKMPQTDQKALGEGLGFGLGKSLKGGL